MLSSDFKKALKLFSRALKAYQAQEDTIDDLGVVYAAKSSANYHLERLTESICDADRAIDVRPNWSKGYFRRAEALLKQGLEAAALEEYQHAFSLVRAIYSIF